MELHQVRYVQAVAECGSFTAAAAQLYLAQPSLSTQVRKLERELRVELFERGGTATRLTPAGERFLAHAGRALVELDRARVAALDAARERTAAVSFGVLPSVGCSLLPDLIGPLRDEQVALSLVECDTSDELADLVGDGRLDLAVIRAQALRTGLAGRPLAREPLAVLLPPAHPLVGRRDLHLRELAGEPFVAMPAGTSLREAFDAACTRVDVVPEVRAEARQLASVWALVRAGVGVGVLPAFALDPKLPGVRLCDEFLHRELVVAWRRGARLDTAHEAVVNGLVAAAARRLDSSFARPRDPFYPMPAATPA